jgi:uncharacterized membrane protein YvbJ
MVTCSKCGKDNQPEATYCDNCGIPVYREQGESLQTGYKERMTFFIGIIVALTLIGLGIVLSLYAANFGMAGSEIIGYVMLVGGIVLLMVDYIMFGRSH